MSSRGGGGGGRRSGRRGGYGGGGGGGVYGNAKQLPFEPFPEIEGLGTAKNVEEARTLGIWYLKFDRYYKSSPYYLEDGDDSSKKLKTELETFSNRGPVKKAPKGRLSDFIYMDPIYVPGELAKGYKMGRVSVKRVKWNPETDKQQLEALFEKNFQEHNEKVKVENSVKAEEEEEGEDVVNEEEEEEEDNGDYDQNVDFDDDEDPYNEEEIVDDEGGDY